MQPAQTRKILYLDMDGVLVDFESAFSRLAPGVLESYAGHMDEVPRIFSLMAPMPDAIDAFQELSELYDTYILSTAPWGNPTASGDKLAWVKRHLGQPANKRLILSHHKQLNQGDYLVDDRPNNGADRFKGELIRFGSSDFPHWASVLPYLRERA